MAHVMQRSFFTFFSPTIHIETCLQFPDIFQAACKHGSIIRSLMQYFHFTKYQKQGNLEHVTKWQCSLWVIGKWSDEAEAKTSFTLMFCGNSKLVQQSVLEQMKEGLRKKMSPPQRKDAMFSIDNQCSPTTLSNRSDIECIEGG